MTRFRRQLFTGLFALIAATAGALWLNNKFNALPNYAFFTGWVLLAGMFTLTTTFYFTTAAPHFAARFLNI